MLLTRTMHEDYAISLSPFFFSLSLFFSFHFFLFHFSFFIILFLFFFFLFFFAIFQNSTQIRVGDSEVAVFVSSFVLGIKQSRHFESGYLKAVFCEINLPEQGRVMRYDKIMSFNENVEESRSCTNCVLTRHYVPLCD